MKDKSYYKNVDEVFSFLETAKEGAFIENEENGRYVEVVDMVCGRYLCMERDEFCKVTNQEAVAYNFLMQ